MTTLQPEHGHEPGGEIEARHHFDDDLDDIRRGLVAMASMVLENVQRAGVVAVENRLDLVDTVRDADLPINDLYQGLEQRTFEILALQQPVASDLRFLIATTRILYEVERSGDLAVNIANRTASQHGFPQIDDLNRLLAWLAKESATVIGNRLDLVDVVRDADKPINELYANLHDLAFQILARQQPVAVDLRFLIATTRILYEAERSGDLAVNIVNRVAAHNGFPQIPAIHSLLARLVEESCAMFAQAVEALATFDPEIGDQRRSGGRRRGHHHHALLRNRARAQHRDRPRLGR